MQDGALLFLFHTPALGSIKGIHEEVSVALVEEFIRRIRQQIRKSGSHTGRVDHIVQMFELSLNIYKQPVTEDLKRKRRPDD